MNTVLIIDDEDKLRILLSKIIGLEGFEVLQAADVKSGLRKLETFTVDVVLCDVKLPDGSGIETTRLIKEKHPEIEVILLTAYGNISDGVQAIKNGAFDYITKGDDNNKIIPLVYKALQKTALARRIVQLEKQLGHKYSFEGIVGKSQNIKSAILEAKKVADSDTTILLTGETGTGKEVFAQSIHNISSRRRQAFIAVNCSAFSKELLENELFGHKAGAYTGALKDSRGILEEAHHGTVFLDEIGEMPLELQAKVLRVIESGEYLKVGDSKPAKVDVRIIAATNRNLKNEMEAGRFREDLFYRIAVFEIHLPPLRERTADIEDLAYLFLRKCTDHSSKYITAISQEYLELLKQHQWKGNIRELRNVIERSTILTDGPSLMKESLPFEIQQIRAISANGRIVSAFELATAEKNHIRNVLNHTNGNKTKTAELLGIAVTTLYRKLNEYGIA